MPPPARRRWLVEAVAGLAAWAGRHRPTRLHLLIVVAAVLLLVVIAAFNQHRSGFVIHARSEAVRIGAIKPFPNDGWRIDGAELCEDRPFTAAEPEPPPICLAALPPEPFFTPADGSAVTIRSLEKGRLEVVIVPDVAAAGEAEAAAAGKGSRLRPYAGGSAEMRFSGTVRITWTGVAPQSPLVFLGPAQIGFSPESGTPGLTMGGTAAGYMAARGGAPRFEVSRAEIVPGDVISAEMPGRRSLLHRQTCDLLAGLRIIDRESCETAGPMHGVILFDPEEDERGFEIVYAGPAQRIIVDRLGARFELAPDWTSRIRNDPLLLILFGAITLAISIAGLVLGQRKGK
ncbi:hypothetical protein [Tabrizicola sp. TH137]|uniref:hypothetical protein n=1 Tax=Tabrizicola sp. TH137 TaxID=2067452 RepID=UPI00117F0278|nr:hypothetical protein [Tabrizicola sp. TH137]